MTTDELINKIKYTIKCYGRYSQYGKTDVFANDIEEIIKEYERVNTANTCS